MRTNKNQVLFKVLPYSVIVVNQQIIKCKAEESLIIKIKKNNMQENFNTINFMVKELFIMKNLKLIMNLTQRTLEMHS